MFLPKLDESINAAIRRTKEVDPRRTKQIENYAIVISRELQKRGQTELVFICTHNSRRSHLSQIWAQIAAWHYGLAIQCYSGGTESTAFYPSAVSALAAAGCLISREGADNPVYQIQTGEGKVIRSFSKTYDDPSNPQNDFFAFLTCNDAEEKCPVILGALDRFSLNYLDPKAYDGSSKETEMYQERCDQISIEMFLLMQFVTDFLEQGQSAS
ncbi:MAG: arsenate reductase [Cyclobacteriaceae bacterium]|jgi:arsenate reductase